MEDKGKVEFGIVLILLYCRRAIHVGEGLKAPWSLLTICGTLYKNEKLDSKRT